GAADLPPQVPQQARREERKRQPAAPLQDMPGGHANYLDIRGIAGHVPRPAPVAGNEDDVVSCLSQGADFEIDESFHTADVWQGKVGDYDDFHGKNRGGAGPSQPIEPAALPAGRRGPGAIAGPHVTNMRAPPITQPTAASSSTPPEPTDSPI